MNQTGNFNETGDEFRGLNRQVPWQGVEAALIGARMS